MQRRSRFTFRTSVVLLAVLLNALAVVAAFATSIPGIVFPGSVPAAEATSTLTGKVPANQEIYVDLVLPLSNPTGAATLVSRLYNPSDPTYGQYLTPAQFASQFGASVTNYDTIFTWARNNGLYYGQTSVNHCLLTVYGSAAQINAAFGVTLNNYVDSNQKAYFAPAVNPTIPANIAGMLTAIIGLSNYATLKPLSIPLTPELKYSRGLEQGVASPQFGYGTGHNGAYTASDLNKGYDMPGPPYQGQGQDVAVYEEGGFFDYDIQQYKTYNNLPDTPVVVRPVDGYGGGVSDLGVAAEAALDIDMMCAIAPYASKVYVYEAAPPFAPSLLNSLAAMADDNKAKSISISYGLDEVLQGTQQIAAENIFFTQLAAQGQGVFASAGDNGAYGDTGDGLNVLDPSSQPLVTGVGGTTLYENIYQQYLGELTWNALGIGGGATGGGVSSVWSIPSYQVVDGSSIATTNGGSSTYRNVPDIAAVGDPFTGVNIYSTSYGGWTAIGGTSVASPIWGAYGALVNQVRHGVGLPTLGLANPSLYEIGTGFLSYFDLHDVIDGDNGNTSLYGIPGFNAGFGYDNVTGFGSFDGEQLVGDLASQSNGVTNPPPAPNGFTGYGGNMDAVLSWDTTPHAKGYFLYRISPTGELVLIASTTKTKYTDTALTNGTLYEYYLAAVNKGGLTYVPYPIYVLPVASGG